MTKVSLSAMKEIAIKAFSPKKSEKLAESAVKEGGERMLANGQDAAAIQGRAMVKPFEKPKMESANLKKENTKAASSGSIIDVGGSGDPLFAPEHNSYSPGSREAFEEELSGLFEDLGL